MIREDPYRVDISDTADLRIGKVSPLIPPSLLLEELPITVDCIATVTKGRREVQAILNGEDNRLLVVVGPCSIHNSDLAIDYASRLKKFADEVKDRMLLVMRVYFEKPRTTIGWKGLINDPDLDGSFKINKGLRKARKLLIDINSIGVPVGCEFLDTISPQYTADLVSWGAIGARTTECQLHRELASGLSMPVGFKNGTSGDTTIAIDAIRSAANPHHFLGVNTQGLAAIVTTTGNVDCHVILRGGNKGPNFYEKDIQDLKQSLAKLGLKQRVIIDCSHGNSLKNHKNQISVAKNIGDQISKGEKAIVGVMIESNIVEGKQDLGSGKSLVYGQSITDACLGYDETVEVIRRLGDSIGQRSFTPNGNM